MHAKQYQADNNLFCLTSKPTGIGVGSSITQLISLVIQNDATCECGRTESDSMIDEMSVEARKQPGAAAGLVHLPNHERLEAVPACR